MWKTYNSEVALYIEVAAYNNEVVAYNEGQGHNEVQSPCGNNQSI